MHLIKLFIIALAAHLVTSNLDAQKQLTKSVKAEVVNNLARSLLDNYIFADKAQNMKKLIRKNLAAGLYDNITYPEEFAYYLTKDLRSVYKDLHLSVSFNKRLEKKLSDTANKSSTEQTKAIEEAKSQNFGFKKAEIINGNIGYIYFDGFYDLNEDSRTKVENVFTSLRSSEALIIDLRDNGGGSPDMVKYICSFLFSKPTHINDLYERRTNKTQSYWTEPVKGSEFFSRIPVYVLISNRTFSAAEEFAYDLQVLHRAQLIGETTGGGAHPVSPQLLTNGFIGFIPYARAVNPVTKTNWEGAGVMPDVKVAPDNALDEAVLAYYDFEIASLKDSNKLKTIRWSRLMLNAKIHPFNVDTLTLISYTGKFGNETFTYNNGMLYMKAKNGKTSRLVALSQTTFKPEEIDHFKLKFIKNTAGQIIEVLVTYKDGYILTVKKE
jgi:hypothetical protein